MDTHQATRTLQVIRTLMERTCQYQFLTARAGLAAGLMAGVGALLFVYLDPNDPWQFGAVWGLVFIGSLAATLFSTILRVRERGEQVWTRPARAVVQALAPALFVAVILSVFFFARGWHLWLPGVWLLCYGQGALATAVYAPQPIRYLGLGALGMGAVALLLGPAWATAMMGFAFGLGHIALGLALLWSERRDTQLRLYRSVA